MSKFATLFDWFGREPAIRKIQPSINGLDEHSVGAAAPAVSECVGNPANDASCLKEFLTSGEQIRRTTDATRGGVVMFKMLRKLPRDNSGATAIEYGLIIALVVIAIIVSMSSVANESTGLWATITNKSQTAVDQVKV